MIMTSRKRRSIEKMNRKSLNEDINYIDNS